MANSNAVMLPSNVRPIKYDLTLEPNLIDFTFSGNETVEIEILQPTPRIVLNLAEITVQSCKLDLPNGHSMTPRDIVISDAEETVIFDFNTKIPTGIAHLTIEFRGTLNDRLHGFYRSGYTNIDGNECFMATTQFEPTDARRAFPCWDEPSLKAIFNVTLSISPDLVAISNMPVIWEERQKPGKKAVHFAESPIMSTYLLAFVVGDLGVIEQEASDGTLIRIWAIRGKEDQGRFALETSVRLLAYFNDYFGIPYPLPKLDHLAIPDFAAGAMENWGAITYRETTLLVDPNNSSASTKQLVAAIISHEMAHMWFGDLVTMAWWNDLWLNESFASWMGDKAIDHLFPDWEMWTQFLTADTNTALSLDGLKSSHPIEQEVKNPAEIGELFDAISYSKGGSLLRMLETFLGENTFQTGLHNYLADHKYDNARTEDLWESLGNTSGQPVALIMDTWVKQTGYPVISLQVERKDDSAAIEFSQKRFLYENIMGNQEADSTLWQVPISMRTANLAQPVVTLMHEAKTDKCLALTSRDEWIKINPVQTGFYRVNYPRDELANLTLPIQDLTLPPNDRLGIQNDAYALARAGHIQGTDFLQLAKAYKNETDASVCSDLASNLKSIDRLLWGMDYYPKFQQYVLDIFRPISQRIGWDTKPEERDMDALLRSTVLGQLGYYADESTLNEASQRFQLYSQDPSLVNPDIRNIVFTLAAKNGDSSTYEMMSVMERETSSQEEKVRLLVGLTQYSQPDLLMETLNKSLSGDVRSQDTITMIIWSAATRIGRDLTWEFVKDNWAEFDRRYGQGGFQIMRLVSITSGFTTEEKCQDVEQFFRNHPTPAADMSIKQSLERVRLNIEWLKRNHNGLETWFAAQYKKE